MYALLYIYIYTHMHYSFMFVVVMCLCFIGLFGLFLLLSSASMERSARAILHMRNLPGWLRLGWLNIPLHFINIAYRP